MDLNLELPQLKAKDPTVWERASQVIPEDGNSDFTAPISQSPQRSVRNRFRVRRAAALQWHRQRSDLQGSAQTCLEWRLWRFCVSQCVRNCLQFWFCYYILTLQFVHLFYSSLVSNIYGIPECANLCVYLFLTYFLGLFFFCPFAPILICLFMIYHGII